MYVGVDEELVVVETAQQGIRLVYVFLGISGVFRGRADKAGGDVGVHRIGLDPGGVSPVAQRFNEVEGNAVTLVVEDGHLLVPVAGGRQVYVNFAYVHDGVPDPGIVLHTAAFRAGALVVDEAAVGQVPFAQVVAGNKVVVVARFLVLEDAGAAVVLHFGRYVQGRQDVLGGGDAEVVRGQCGVIQEVTGIFQLRIRRLGVELRQVVGREGPAFQGLVEGGGSLFVPLEPVVLLHGRSGHAQPGGAHVLSHERIIVEMVIGRCVPLENLHAVVQAVVFPGDEALVVQ